MSEESMELFLVRHGATEWSQSGQHTGTTDLELLPHGEHQARALHGRLAPHRFALVLTSPLRRARRTAELAGFGDRAEVAEDLREVEYGEYEGRTSKEIRAERPDWEFFRDGTPGGETLEQAAARCERVLERARAAGGNVLLFAHGHILRILTTRYLELPVQYGRRFPLAAAAVSVLGSEYGQPALLRWNDTGHL